MRVTNSILHRNFLFHLNRNHRRMEEHQREISSGQKVSKPSDDPLAAATILNLGDTRNRVEQYERNVGNVKLFLERSDSVLGELNTLLARAKELTVYGASDTIGAEARQAIAQEVAEIRNQAVTIANSRHLDKFIFAGTNTLTQPFQDVAGTIVYTGNSDRISMQISDSDTLAMNVTGDQVFTSTDDIFATLESLRAALVANDPVAVTNQLSRLEAIEQQVLLTRAEVGALMARADDTEQRYSIDRVDLTSQMSKVGDVDIAAAASNLVQQETNVRAALSAGARILQNSLLDYLA